MRDNMESGVYPIPKKGLSNLPKVNQNLSLSRSTC